MPEQFVSPFDQESLHRLFVDNFKVRDVTLKLPLLEVADRSIALGRMDPQFAEADGEVPRLGEGEALWEGMRQLQKHPLVLVESAGQVCGFLHGRCLNQPAARMWLFGLIGVMDRHIVHAIHISHPGESWRNLLSPARLQAAIELREERIRRGSHPDLLGCLQVSDKIKVLMSDPRLAAALGFRSRRHLRRAMQALELLRNHLAHHQDIYPDCVEAALAMADRLEELLQASRLGRALQILQRHRPV